MPKILLGITGSVAAIKIPLLVHKISEAGYNCKVIISHDGLNFVTPMAISAMGADVYLDDNINTTSYEQVMQHINLGKWADYILICPASANNIAKLSMGFADNLISQSVLASSAKKIIVPAMNQQMWKNSLTQRNIHTLINQGFIFWGPVSGLQACGDNDVGRMLEIEEIFNNIQALNDGKTGPLKGKHIVITAGGTKEMIDPVRYISNHSSGKMAYALAENAVALGAKVSLISSSHLPVPQGTTLIPVTTGDEMLNASLELAPLTDIFIGAAAVCDYKIKNYTPQKMKKAKTISLDLVATTDILKTLRRQYPKLFIVGFAAETDNLAELAVKKLVNKKLNLIVANDVSNQQVFNQDTNKVIIINQQHEQFVSDKTTKDNIAKLILKHILKKYQ